MSIPTLPAAPPKVRSRQARSGGANSAGERPLASAAEGLSEANLGEKVSIYFRLHGDPDHPFSEVIGLLQRIDRSDDQSRTLHVVRRTGEVVAVAEKDLISLKRFSPAG